jgi:hypothetical protein
MDGDHSRSVTPVPTPPHPHPELVMPTIPPVMIPGPHSASADRSAATLSLSPRTAPRSPGAVRARPTRSDPLDTSLGESTPLMRMHAINDEGDDLSACFCASRHVDYAVQLFACVCMHAFQLTALQASCSPLPMIATRRSRAVLAVSPARPRLHGG